MRPAWRSSIDSITGLKFLGITGKKCWVAQRKRQPLADTTCWSLPRRELWSGKLARSGTCLEELSSLRSVDDDALGESASTPDWFLRFPEYTVTASVLSFLTSLFFKMGAYQKMYSHLLSYVKYPTYLVSKRQNKNKVVEMKMTRIVHDHT